MKCVARPLFGTVLLTTCAFAIAAPPDQQPPEGQPRIVTVTAEGYDRDDALKQALRKALEQGAGQQIASFSKVQDFELIRDTIYSRAAGVVSDYDILEEKKLAGGTVELTIRATVRPDAVAQAWGEVQNVLDQIGRPKIMVWIDEKIDGDLQSSSMVESGIEELFVEAGFDLVAQEGIEELRRRERQDAQRADNASKIARLAKDAGAHILIRGYANANRAGIERVYGVAAAFYNCDVQAKVYYTDTGQLLASESIPVTRSGVRSHHAYSPQAARAALKAATFPGAGPRHTPALATRIYEAVMRQWATIITAGGSIDFEVENLDYKTYSRLRKALQTLKGVKSVDGDFTKNTGVFRIKADLSAQTLADQLIEPPFDEWIEINDLKPNRIQARAVKTE